jgi:aerobic-type carbon monoxide dehydrogenase small subunit (CoxS/CutS family)
VNVELTLNGRLLRQAVEPNETLLHFVRDRLGLTGTKSSCEVQVCGACTVLVDGLPVSSCCYLASEAAGREVTTVEGLAGEDVDRLRAAFARHGAVQCGFCIPGMELTVIGLLRGGGVRTADDLTRGLAGNLCRCTGYRAILRAACEAARIVR